LIVRRDLLAALKDHQALPIGAVLGFEAQHLSFRLFSHLRKQFANIKLVATEHIVEKIAIPKEPKEIACMRKAAAMTCAVWDQLLPLLRRGVTEADLAAEILYRGRKLGSETDAFEPIVASGPRGALPHARSSPRRLQPGDFVVIDYGCVVEGYAADVTRTVAVGEPPPQLLKAYMAVKAACKLACEVIRPGMKGSDLDKVARDLLDSHGFKEQFNHSLGHGLGLDVHALPRIGPESNDIIPAQAVVTIEPGVYFPGLGGVRIEDDVLVTETRSEVLTPISRELFVVE
jgi:Xaa-Pro aminopeptidase